MARETFGACVSFRACWALEAARTGEWHGKESDVRLGFAPRDSIRRGSNICMMRSGRELGRGDGGGHEVDNTISGEGVVSWRLARREKDPIRTWWQSSSLSSILRSSTPQLDERKSRASQLRLLGHLGLTKVRERVR